MTVTKKDYEKMRGELSKLTVKQLRDIARKEGICLGYAGSNKAGTVNEVVSQREYREREGYGEE